MKDLSSSKTIPGSERIAKRMASAGLCSRREAERWIADGRVSLNGVVITSPAVTVTDADTIVVDGQPLKGASETRLWLYHKPRGLLTTMYDPDGRPTVFEYLPEHLPRVISVGRLDMNSEGLLLLTTSGELARSLELPSNGWKRLYRVRMNGTPDDKTLKALARGPTIEKIHYAPIQVEIERTQGDNCWLNVTLSEGKNREIRKVFGYYGHEVSRLIRVEYGPFKLGNLEQNEVREVSRAQIKALSNPAK